MGLLEKTDEAVAGPFLGSAADMESAVGVGREDVDFGNKEKRQCPDE